MQKSMIAGLFVLLLVSFSCSKPAYRGDYGAGLRALDAYTLVGEKSLLNSSAPRNDDGTINVVVEIPTGTNAKWEVSKKDGSLRWEFKKGQPRVVKYLGYPGNYGMIPGTLLPRSLGGDGDPLDVIVLGPAVPRGSVVSAKVVGILKLLDDGEQDDKIIAVMKDSPLETVDSIAELDEKFPGVTTIVETWFTYYKGRGEMESRGFAGVEAAQKVIDAAIAAFQ